MGPLLLSHLKNEDAKPHRDHLGYPVTWGDQVFAKGGPVGHVLRDRGEVALAGRKGSL